MTSLPAAVCCAMRVVSCFFLFALIGGVSIAQAQTDDASLRRYVELLERQPKVGTVFDKIYAAHAERGTLAEFAAAYRQRMTEKRDDAAALIVGLVELQRGRDADAIAALRMAEQTRVKDAQPSLVLSRALLLIGDLDGALQAFDRALERKPNRLDVLEAALTLGQSLLRAARNSDAERVWRQLDDLFPDDARVQERLAVTIGSSGEHAAAAVRFEKLSRSATEPNQRVQFKIRALEERVLSGTKLSEVLGQFETLQSDLKSDSWLAKDVGQRIEQLFLRTDDLAGLTAYYRKQAVARPEDIGRQTRLVELLARRGQSEDAIGVLDAAIAKQPTNASLRRTLINLLLKSRCFADAQKQYAELDRIEPKNADTLRGWGSAVLQDESQPQDSRRKSALGIWMRIVDDDRERQGASRRSVPPSNKDANDKDKGPTASALPLTLLQTAELLKRNGFENEALDLYQRAVQLAPQEAQYREELGEFLLSIGRREAALAAWREIASGDRATHENLVRLAVVLHRAGVRDEALRVMSAACREEATVDELLKLAEFQREARQADDVARVLSRAAQLAKTDDEQQRVQNAELDWLVESSKLFDEIVRAKLIAVQENSAAKWRRLAVLNRAARNSDDALRAIRRALEIEPNDIATLREAAQIAMSAGQHQEALTLYRTLRSASAQSAKSAASLTQIGDVLRQIAQLESRLGRVDAALQAAREMTEIAPGNREYLDFFANLCLQHGRVEEALGSLRRAARGNPTDAGLLLQLAGVLATHDRVNEAIDAAWQGYEVAKEPRDHVRIAERLALWHQQTNRWPACVERLERRKREPANEYSATLSLAAAYRAIGDSDAARKELATQLVSRPDDVELLRQLVLDAESHHHWSDAVDFQARLVERQPTMADRIKLVLLTDHSGDQVAAIARARELAAEQREPKAFLEFADELLDRGRFELAARLLDERLRKSSERVGQTNGATGESRSSDWESSVRLGIALWRTGRVAGARARFAEVLEMNLPIELLSQRVSRQQTESANEQRRSPAEIHWRRGDAARGIATYLDLRDFRELPRSLPRDFGEARIAARTALLLIECELQDSLIDSAQDNGFGERCLRNHVPGLKRVELRLRHAAPHRFQVKRPQSDAPQEFSEAELWEWYHALGLQLSKRARWQPMFARLRFEAAARLAYRREAVGQWALLRVFAPLDQSIDESHDVFAPDARLIGLGADKDDMPRLKELSGLLELVDECRVGVATGPYEWMKTARPAVTAVVDEEDLTTAADLLKLPVSRRPPRIELDKLKEWVSAALQQRDPETYIALFEFDVRQAAQTDARIALTGFWEEEPVSDVAFCMEEQLRRYDWASRKRAKGDARIDIVDVTPTDAIRTPLMSSVLERLAKPFAAEDAAVRHARCRARMLLLWKSEQKDAALRVLQIAFEEMPQHYPLRFELALLLRELGHKSDALELLRDAPVSDWKSLHHRDRALVEFGQEAGDAALVKAAAQRLAVLKASADIERDIVELLLKLPFRNLALLKLNTLRQRAGSNLDELNRVLSGYVRLKATEQAAEVAHEVLQVVPDYPEKSQGTYTLTSTTHVSHAEQALKNASHATLNRLAAKVEADLAAHPQAGRSRELLALYQRLLGTTKAVTTEPSAIGDVTNLTPSQLLERARDLAAAHHDAQASDLALSAYRRDPSLLVNDFATARRILVPAKRAAELITLIVDRKLWEQAAVREAAIELALDTLGDPLNLDAATKLLTTVWPVIPDERLIEIGRIAHPHLWRQESEFTRWARQAVVPQTPAAGKRRWLGISGTAHLDRQSGIGSCALTRHLDASDGASLRAVTQVALGKYPDWKTGEIILALLDANDGRGDAFERRLTALAAEDDLPAEVQFFIAQESARRLAVERMASRVIQLLVKRPHRESRDLTLDPAFVIARIHARAGQKAEQVAVLTDWLKRQDSVREELKLTSEAEQFRAIKNGHQVAYELMLRRNRAAALKVAIETTRRLVAMSRVAPKSALRNLADELFMTTSLAMDCEPAEQQQFLASWIRDDQPVELLSILVECSEGRLHATNFISAFFDDDRAFGRSEISSDLLAKLRRRQLADSDIATRVAILQIDHVDRLTDAATFERDYQQLVAAAAHATSDAALLDITPLLGDGLLHASAPVRALARKLADQVLPAAHRTSPQWEAAVINELLTAAHSLGDFAVEDELQQRLRALKFD